MHWSQPQCRNWKSLEFKFFETLSDVAGDPLMLSRRGRARHQGFWPSAPTQQDLQMFALRWGLPISSRVGSPPGEGRLLRTVSGVEIRAADAELVEDRWSVCWSPAS